MPKHKNLNDLTVAISDFIEEFCEDVWPSLRNTKEVQEFKRLSDVYFEAYNSPPEGVIGVGKVTYAEQKLIEAQEG